MFINFWYPALWSSDLGQSPVRLRMLGHDFVLARDEAGTAFCLANTCSHRGGSLGNGRMRGSEIECPYHGWRFGQTGECTRIPSLGTGARIPARTRIDSYPVVERYGLVFAFLGDLPEEERPDIMRIPEYEQEGWRHNCMTFEGNCHYERSVENALDPAHTSFVHGFGAPDTAAEFDMEQHGWGASFMTEFFDTPGTRPSFVPRAGTGFHGASQFYTLIEGGPSWHTNQYMFETPIDGSQIRIFLVCTRNRNLGKEFDAGLIANCTRVVNQDLAVLESLHPVETPERPGREFLVNADKPIGSYRAWLSHWEQRGWRIDTERLNRDRHRIAYAIPSPARRQGGSWVLDPVPLLPPVPA